MKTTLTQEEIIVKLLTIIEKLTTIIDNYHRGKIYLPLEEHNLWERTK